MGIQSNRLAVELLPFYGAEHRSSSHTVLQPVTHTIVPKSWDFKSILALNEVSTLAGWCSTGSRRVVGGNFSHQAIGGSSRE